MLGCGSRASTVVGLLAVAACGVQASPELTIVGSMNERIVGGQTIEGLPAVGALTYYGEPFCTGTLVGPRVVATAAHCLEGMQAGAIRFALGTHTDAPDHVLAVSKVVTHPSYNARYVTDDIGALVLQDEAPVQPMRALGAMDASFIGKRLLFVGFGVTSGSSSREKGTKRAVTIPITDVTPSAFRYAEAGHNTCRGDSGGPAFYLAPSDELLLAGVTSWGDAYCRSFGVDTRVDVYLDFFGLDGVLPDDGPPTSSPPTDPCQGETYEGRCDQGTVVFCEDGQVHALNCSGAGMSCGWDSPKKIFNCLR